MKVIDLLNKIANGEKVPKIIKFGDDKYYLQDSDDLENLYWSEELYCWTRNVPIHLNDEIIEEPKKIEEFQFCKDNTIIDHDLQDIKNKLNEVIAKVIEMSDSNE